MQRRAFLSGVLAFSVIPRAYAASFQFPDVLGSTEEGKETHLSTVLQSYSGRPLLLHAWASYCQPCIADIPLLKELEQSLPVLGLYLIARSFEENTKMIQKIHNNEYGKNLLLEGSSQKIFKEKYEEQTRNKFVILSLIHI